MSVKVINAASELPKAIKDCRLAHIFSYRDSHVVALIIDSQTAYMNVEITGDAPVKFVDHFLITHDPDTVEKIKRNRHYTVECNVRIGDENLGDRSVSISTAELPGGAILAEYALLEAVQSEIAEEYRRQESKIRNELQ